MFDAALFRCSLRSGQARAVNGRGVALLQQKITECLQKLQRHAVRLKRIAIVAIYVRKKKARRGAPLAPSDACRFPSTARAAYWYDTSICDENKTQPSKKNKPEHWALDIPFRDPGVLITVSARYVRTLCSKSKSLLSCLSAGLSVCPPLATPEK